MTTKDKISALTEKYNMVKTGDTVILAVSGGADSMCLLHFFNDYSRVKSFNLVVAHVNHGIRGAEADRDEEFVRSYCEKINVQFKCAHYNIPELARKSGESEELCGRRLRYEFFASINSEAKIATAHNLNDCMETFMFNLSRGTGVKGLSGIPPVRDNIIRPLITCTRAEIEQYLKENGVDFVTDSTNLSDRYSRNKIRHNIIPVMNELNPSFGNVFLNCLNVLSDTEDFLEKETDKAYTDSFDHKNDCFSAEKISGLHKALRDRVLMKIVAHFGAVEAEYKHISVISDFLLKGGSVELPGKVIVSSDGKKLYKKIFVKVHNENFEQELELNKVYSVSSSELIVKHIDKDSINLYNIMQPPFMSYIDENTLTGAVVRNRREGDRFRYPKSEHSKSLKKLFAEKGVPPEERGKRLIIAQKDNILWIEGIGTSSYGAVSSETENICLIETTLLF